MKICATTQLRFEIDNVRAIARLSTEPWAVYLELTHDVSYRLTGDAAQYAWNFVTDHTRELGLIPTAYIRDREAARP